MKKFTCVQDIGNLKAALDEAFEIKKDRFKYVELGRNKTLMMIFFNSSLRTRLSTQKAATNLGMNVIVLDINGTRRHHGWRQTRTSTGGYSCDGLLLRHHRCTFVRPL